MKTNVPNDLWFSKYNLLKLQGIFLVALILFYDHSDAQVFKKQFNEYRGVREMIETYDGGKVFMVTGQNHGYDGKLFKLNQAGEKVWEIGIHPQDSFIFNDIAELSTGELIIVGETFQYWSPYFPNETPQSIDGVMAKINVCGEIEWVKLVLLDHLGVKACDPLRRVAIDKEDNIWVHHYINIIYEPHLDSYFNGKRGSEFHIKKFNSDGELLKQTDNHYITDGGGIVFELIPTPEKGVIFCGDNYELPYYEPNIPDSAQTVYLRPFIMKLDSTCEPEWTYVHKWEEDEVFNPGDIIDRKFEIGTVSSIVNIADSLFFCLNFKDHYETSINKKSAYLNFFILNNMGERIYDTILYNPPLGFGGGHLLKASDSVIYSVSHAVNLTLPEDTDSRLHVYKINLNTQALDLVYVDSTNYYTKQRIVADKNTGELWIGSVKQFTPGVSAVIQKIDPITYQPVAFWSSDSNAYDTLCPGSFSPGIIDLPDDTTTYIHPDSIGLPNISKAWDVKVYQPDAHTLTFLHDYAYLNITAINAKGEQVLTVLNFTKTNLDINHLAFGAYYFTITLPSGDSFTHTVVKRK
jgi:hypothetical protein